MERKHIFYNTIQANILQRKRRPVTRSPIPTLRGILYEKDRIENHLCFFDVIILLLFIGTLGDIFKISLNFFLDILVRVPDPAFRKHFVHLICNLWIR